jgi:hypothetical protein
LGSFVARVWVRSARENGFVLRQVLGSFGARTWVRSARRALGSNGIHGHARSADGPKFGGRHPSDKIAHWFVRLIKEQERNQRLIESSNFEDRDIASTRENRERRIPGRTRAELDAPTYVM